LDDEKRTEYGDAYFGRFVEMAADVPQALSWKLDAVIDTAMNAVTVRDVEPSMIVGLDGRYLLTLLRMLPAWVLDWLDTLDPRPIPAVMK
jgi:hypothetical protein